MNRSFVLRKSEESISQPDLSISGVDDERCENLLVKYT